MPRFAANLSMLYPELPFLDRFEAAAKDGFKAVEYLFPYAYPPRRAVAPASQQPAAGAVQRAPGGTDCPLHRPGLERGAKASACRGARMNSAPVCAGAGLRAGAGLPAHPPDGRPGARRAPTARRRCSATYVANLRWAAEQAAPHGRDVLIEPINTRDIPGFFLNRQDQAHAIVAEVGAPNLKVQMDLYHCQIVEGDLAMKIASTCPPAASATSRSPACPSATSPTWASCTTPTCSA
jgi:hydroxypyruvate isomerase